MTEAEFYDKCQKIGLHTRWLMPKKVQIFLDRELKKALTHGGEHWFTQCINDASKSFDTSFPIAKELIRNGNNDAKKMKIEYMQRKLDDSFVRVVNESHVSKWCSFKVIVHPELEDEYIGIMVAAFLSPKNIIQNLFKR